MLKIEILNRPPTTVSKRMESEDPDETTYVFVWRRKPYCLAVAISAPPVVRAPSELMEEWEQLELLLSE